MSSTESATCSGHVRARPAARPGAGREPRRGRTGGAGRERRDAGTRKAPGQARSAWRAAQTCARNCPSSSPDPNTPSLAMSPAESSGGTSFRPACSSAGPGPVPGDSPPLKLLRNSSSTSARRYRGLPSAVADLGQPPASRQPHHGLRGHPEQERHLAARHQVLIRMVTGHPGSPPLPGYGKWPPSWARSRA